MPDEDARLRVATLNAWGVRGDWPGRGQKLVAGFAALDADLITVQEVIVTEDFDQVREMLGPDYHLVHHSDRESDGQGISTASRWPVGQVREVDLNVTERTAGFACTALVTEILAPSPWDRIWLVNHLPDYRLDHEHERCGQAVAVAAEITRLTADRPGHVVIAGDFDADPGAASMRFWTGREPLAGLSVCYRDAWASGHPELAADDPKGHTYVPDNPYSVDWDWPFRRIDYILVGTARIGGPTLMVTSCERMMDGPDTCASDHYGLIAELAIPVKN
ncbi:MAG TPA: endonuclease/exonuclease/phosphatase family protein [Pseudonocardiaceae bacterium]|jgi:endonuclease/exonuclease/phosphatase family metal-dependent hydrolase|nr:endonuclease/exonuclease/phosphatase family protein [Pseudonocardiaceae bacterium]